MPAAAGLVAFCLPLCGCEQCSNARSGGGRFVHLDLAGVIVCRTTDAAGFFVSPFPDSVFKPAVFIASVFFYVGVIDSQLELPSPFFL